MMIVPQFWAEGFIRDRVDGRQVTIRRFGWSDASQAEAQAHADERAREAMERVRSGVQVERRDLKRAYNGSEGVPIREEIISRIGETVITRNSYGALCLNTPNVLFADIDFSDEPGCATVVIFSGAVLSLVAFLAWNVHWGFACAGVLVVPLVGYFAALWLTQLAIGFAGGTEHLARQSVERFLQSHNDWHVRLYRTPAGLRVLALHRPFDPREPAVAECFEALGTDPIYVRMCQRQNCFRARLTPKPWRVGIGRHMKPGKAIWPIDPERMPERQAWVAEYERASATYASCRFVADLGSGTIHPDAADVLRLHDELCQAQSDLPLA
jgi:hypothetical protein